jgi:oligosaccharide repeat unit polymerase
VYYLERRRRPSLIVAIVSFGAIVLIMGEIGATRQYGLGLDLSKRSSSLTDSVLSGFSEATIFGTSGAVLTHVPQERGFVGFEPIVQAFLMPIPAAFYDNKSSDAYVVGTLLAIYGREAYAGAAYMSFAEWYLAFGWPGLIGFHLLLGVACCWLWRWYLPRQLNPLALVVYASSISYLYVVFSRGYFPQVVTLFFFSVGPAIAIYLWPQKCVFWARVPKAKPSDRARGGAQMPANAGRSR